jgi:hypothetical protein
MKHPLGNNRHGNVSASKESCKATDRETVVSITKIDVCECINGTDGAAKEIHLVGAIASIEPEHDCPTDVDREFIVAGAAQHGAVQDGVRNEEAALPFYQPARFEIVVAGAEIDIDAAACGADLSALQIEQVVAAEREDVAGCTGSEQAVA